MKSVIYLRLENEASPLFKKIMARLYPDGYELEKVGHQAYRLLLPKGIEDLTKFLASFGALSEDADNKMAGIIAPSESIDPSGLLPSLPDGEMLYFYELLGEEGATEVVIESLEGIERETLETVRIYLETGNSPALAGLRLYVHRNTVVYRLSQFSRRTGYDLSRPDVGILLLSIIKKLNKRKKY